MADFVVLSTADWDHLLWTNKQHTALTLAAAGHRVLYVEFLAFVRRGLARPIATASFGVCSACCNCLANGGKALGVVAPGVASGHSGRALRFNRCLLQGARACLSLARVHQPDPLTTTHSPLSISILRALWAAFITALTASRISPACRSLALRPASRRCRRQWMSCSDIAAPSGQPQALEPPHPVVWQCGGPCHFSRACLGDTAGPLSCPERLQGVDRPRLVFIGAIDAYKLDLGLLLQLAQRNSVGGLC